MHPSAPSSPRTTRSPLAIAGMLASWRAAFTAFAWILVAGPLCASQPTLAVSLAEGTLSARSLASTAQPIQLLRRPADRWHLTSGGRVAPKEVRRRA